MSNPYSSYLSKIRASESSGDDSAHNPHGASGRYQFLPSTWKNMGYNLKDIYNPQLQEEAALRLTTNNANYLKKRLGINPTDADLYGAHFLGSAGYANLYQTADNAPISSVMSRLEIAHNPFVKGKTVGFVKNWLAKKMSIKPSATEGYDYGYGVDTSFNLPINTGDYQTAPDIASKEDLEAEKAKAELLQKQKEKDFLTEVQYQQEQDSERRQQQEEQYQQQQQDTGIDQAYYQMPQIALPEYVAPQQMQQQEQQYRDGGQTNDDREMVNGIADILSQVKDPQNRANIAKQMVKDFENQDVVFDYKKFMEMSNLEDREDTTSQFQLGGRKVVKFEDPRKISATTGKAINPNADLKSGYYDDATIRRIVEAAYRHGVDPYTAVSIGLQETGLGKTDDNIGHVTGPQAEKDLGAKSEEEYFVLTIKDKMKYADKLGIKDDLTRIQAYNGLGNVYPTTESGYHGFNMQKIYGVPLTKKGINMRKNPLYGKRVVDLRENVIKNNPTVNEYVKKVKSHPFSGKIDEESMNILGQYYKDGGEIEEKVKCSNCGWSWNKSDSSKEDMYNCHKCGKDNEMKKYEDGGELSEFDNDSARDWWVKRTGKSWAEAKKLGYSDGTASSNIELLNRLKDKNFTIANNNNKTSQRSDMKQFNGFSQEEQNSMQNTQPPVTRKTIKAPVAKAKKEIKEADQVISLFEKVMRGDFSPQGNEMKLQNGVVTDKRTNTNYILENGKVIKSFPVLTGANPDVNINDRGVAYLETHPESKATPRGTYTMNPKGDIYGQPGFRLQPVAAFGEPAARAKDIAQHVTYDFEKRNPLYAQDAKNRYASYGCVNCRKPDINYMTDRFKKGDTTMVIDSKIKRDANFLAKKLFSRK